MLFYSHKLLTLRLSLKTKMRIARHYILWSWDCQFFLQTFSKPRHLRSCSIFVGWAPPTISCRKPHSRLRRVNVERPDRINCADTKAIVNPPRLKSSLSLRWNLRVRRIWGFNCVRPITFVRVHNIQVLRIKASRSLRSQNHPALSLCPLPW